MTATTRTPRTRLSPAQRRTQLLDLGVRLLGERSLDEFSIDLLAEQAGISRGLLYHYFGTKAEFHEAVVRHAAEDLLRTTAPPPTGEPLERLLASVTAYVDYVVENFQGYVSLVRGASGGSEALRGIYDGVRDEMTARTFAETQDALVPDSHRNRLLVRGWLALAEELVIAWKHDPGGVTRAELDALIAGSLPALVATGVATTS